MAEREGFEPSIRFWRILTFQASAFDHSATAPHALEGVRPSGTFRLPQGARICHAGAMNRLEHCATLWRWSSPSAPSVWFFLTIDGAAGEALSALALMRRFELGQARGFGSLKVAARIGTSAWKTSVFPQRGEGWMLPIKAAVRRAEHIGEGDEVVLELEVL